jgi:hypothetical protein
MIFLDDCFYVQLVQGQSRQHAQANVKFRKLVRCSIEFDHDSGVPKNGAFQQHALQQTSVRFQENANRTSKFKTPIAKYFNSHVNFLRRE